MKRDPLRSRSTETEAQLQRLLALLRLAPRTTSMLRAHGIHHPAGRIQDLRRRGFTISTSRVTAVDSDGFEHVGVALYSLHAEPDPTALPGVGAAPVEVSA